MKTVSICATLIVSLGLSTSSHGQDSWGNSNDPLSFSDVPSVPNPFDSGSTSQQPSADTASPNATQPNETLSNGAQQDQDSSTPGGRPVANYSSGMSPADMQYSVLAMTPHVRQAPVQWSHHATTPDPVGEIMLREFCTQGLWQGYAAERAAECAHMWKKLEACKNQCHTGNVGCASCQPCQPVHNRYKLFAPRKSKPKNTDCAAAVPPVVTVPNADSMQQHSAPFGQPTPASLQSQIEMQPQSIANVPANMQR